ncbi:MAG: hypothetical protein LKJ75_04040 [Clostridia bacterium]|jgi:hypothetical protein|nr:hypothetical protein [Clostridia bacterium]MCI2014354.1 hypothetical protein [Clostridia bacterium]
MKKMAVKILGVALLLAALFIPNIIASGKDKEISPTTLAYYASLLSDWK